MIEFMIR